MSDTEKILAMLAGLAGFVALIAYAKKSSGTASVSLAQNTSAPTSGSSSQDQEPPFVPGT